MPDDEISTQGQNRRLQHHLEMVEKQLTYDALRILDFDEDALVAVGAEMHFVGELAHAGKIAQGRFIARKR